MPDRPGTTFAINNGAPAPAIDGNNVVFMENSGTSVLWSVNTVTGVFTRLADTTTAVPGGTSAFDSFNSYQLYNGVVVFSAAGANDPRGLFSVPVTGGIVTKLIDLNTPVPGGTGTLSFDAFNGPYYRFNDGNVLFSASGGVYLVPAAGGTITRISDNTTRPGGNAAQLGDQSGGLAALSFEDGSVYGRTYLYTGAPPVASRSTAAATSTTPRSSRAPARPSPATRRATFSSSVSVTSYGSRGTRWFSPGTAVPGNGGIFDSGIRGLYASVNGVQTKLVDTSTPVPLGAGTFGIPNNGTILPDSNALALRDGQIAFLGHGQRRQRRHLRAARNWRRDHESLCQWRSRPGQRGRFRRVCVGFVRPEPRQGRLHVRHPIRPDEHDRRLPETEHHTHCGR